MSWYDYLTWKDWVMALGGGFLGAAFATLAAFMSSEIAFCRWRRWKP